MLRRKGILLCMIIWIMAAVLTTGGAAWRFAVPSAYAEGEDMILLDIRMSVQPAALVEPGDVTLTFTIANNSDTDAQNLYFSSLDGLLSESIGRIEAGSSQSFSRQHSVTREELDSGEIVYVISHDDPVRDGSKVNYTIKAAITRNDANPEAEFTRRFSSNTVEAGGTVVVTYRIRNAGNVVLNSLRVRDELGDFTGRIERLEVGESRTLVSRVTVTEDCASSASLSYGVEAYEDEAHIITLDNAEIKIASSALESRFSAGYSAFSSSSADVVLLLSNEGSTAYRDICVIDDVNGGVIADSIELLPGDAPVEISAACPVRGDSIFRWRVTGVCETGEKVDFVTETLTLEAQMSENPAEVTTVVETAMPKIRRPGDVSMRVLIENAGDADITGIVLSEETLGEVKNFAVIPSGGFIDREIVVNVQEDSEYRFSVHFTDADGWQRTLECAPVQVDIASDGVLPLGQEPSFIEFNGASIKIGGSSLFAVLLIAGAAVLVVLIIMLLIASRRARIEKQLRQAAQRKRRRETAGKAAQERRKK